MRARPRRLILAVLLGQLVLVFLVGLTLSIVGIFSLGSSANTCTNCPAIGWLLLLLTFATGITTVAGIIGWLQHDGWGTAALALVEILWILGAFTLAWGPAAAIQSLLLVVPALVVLGGLCLVSLGANSRGGGSSVGGPADQVWRPLVSAVAGRSCGAQMAAVTAHPGDLGQQVAAGAVHNANSG